jgi:hypothetical protein
MMLGQYMQQTVEKWKRDLTKMLREARKGKNDTKYQEEER